MTVPGRGLTVHLDPNGCRVRVGGRATGHDFETRFTHVEGTLSGDPEAPQATAKAEIRVLMSSLQTGDMLRDFKTRRFLQPKRHTEAVFELRSLRAPDQAAIAAALSDGGEIAAEASGEVRYRGRSVAIDFNARGSLSAHGSFTGEACFDLDVSDFGLEPPKLLFVKVDPVVCVAVELSGRAERR